MLARKLIALYAILVLCTSSGCCIRRMLCAECCDPCDRGAFTYYPGNSCGEAYYGDWHSYPPKCEPCDQCGNYIGPKGSQVAARRGAPRLASHQAPVSEASSECTSCGH